MKHTNILSAIAAAAVGAMSLTSCEAVWDTSVSSAPYGYYSGWDGEYLPVLAGTPITSPFYYGGVSYPLGAWGPVHRPGTNPWGGPVNPGPAPMPSRPNGNVRPPQSASTPVTLPSATPVPSHPVFENTNPGLQAPPAGSGLHTTTQGRH